MNSQKLQTQREGLRRFKERYLEKIEGAKEEESMVEFNAILKSIEDKVQILDTLNDKILSQTDTDGTEEEAFQTHEYTMEVEIKLCHLRASAEIRVQFTPQRRTQRLPRKFRGQQSAAQQQRFER